MTKSNNKKIKKDPRIRTYPQLFESCKIKQPYLLECLIAISEAWSKDDRYECMDANSQHFIVKLSWTEELEGSPPRKRCKQAVYKRTLQLQVDPDTGEAFWIATADNPRGEAGPDFEFYPHELEEMGLANICLTLKKQTGVRGFKIGEEMFWTNDEGMAIELMAASKNLKDANACVKALRAAAVDR
jgi:hypothetical protein